VQAGDSALHWAAYYGAPNELLQVLIDVGADIKAKNNDDETPADRARESKQTTSATFLDSFLPMTKSANMMV
jgi:ankyrin repeat protein